MNDSNDKVKDWKQEAMKWKQIATQHEQKIQEMGQTLDKIMDSNDIIIKDYVSCKDQLQWAIDCMLKFKQGIDEQTTNQDGSSKSTDLGKIKYYFYGMWQEWYENHSKIKNND